MTSIIINGIELTEGKEFETKFGRYKILEINDDVETYPDSIIKYQLLTPYPGNSVPIKDIQSDFAYDLINSNNFKLITDYPNYNKDELHIQPKALRYNDGKLQWSLVDFKSLEPMVRVLEFGAKKYAPDNWKAGLKTLEICESMLRHIFAYMSGEDNDPESNESHIGHIQCNAMFLAHMQLFKPEFDNRRR